MCAIDNNCLITKHNILLFPAHATGYSDHLMQSFLDPDQISGNVPCVPKTKEAEVNCMWARSCAIRRGYQTIKGQLQRRPERAEIGRHFGLSSFVSCH